MSLICSKRNSPELLFYEVSIQPLPEQFGGVQGREIDVVYKEFGSLQRQPVFSCI